MITTFEEQTQPLTDYERDKLLPIMARCLSTKKGKQNAVTNRAIVAGMTSQGFKINPARCRKIINHIRTNDLVPGLVATSDGYFVAESKQELDEYVESLAGRENAIREVKIAMIRQRERIYGMPTP